MNWYQAISVLVVLYFSWELLVPLYKIINGQDFRIPTTYRIFFTLLFFNLLLAFAGPPWD